MRRGLKTTNGKDKRIKPRYAKTYYELVDAKSDAWNNPYKAYSSTLQHLNSMH